MPPTVEVCHRAVQTVGAPPHPCWPSASNARTVPSSDPTYTRPWSTVGVELDGPMAADHLGGHTAFHSHPGVSGETVAANASSRPERVVTKTVSPAVTGLESITPLV